MDKNKKGLLIPIIVGAVLLCAAIVLLCLVLIPGGGEENSADKGDGEVSGTFSVEVTAQSGKAFEGIGVYIYTDETQKELVWFEKTSKDGKVSFESDSAKGYVIVLKDIPEGYSAKEYYVIEKNETVIVLETVIVEGEDISKITYKVGDVVKDFSVTDTDGKDYRVSELLKDKKAVVLFFWDMESLACKDELPVLMEAYEKYKKEIAILALHPLSADSSAMAELKESLKLSFPLAICEAEWIDALAIDNFPTTVIIDQYGVISLIQRGSLPGAEGYEDIFEFFCDEDYEQSVIEDVDKITSTELQMGSSANPVEIGGVESFDVTVKPGQVVYYNIYKITNQYITISDPDACLIYKGNTYKATNGSVTLSIASSDPMAPVLIGIGNAGVEEKTFHARLAMPAGTMGNPHMLTLGEFSVTVQQGNSQGVYYTYTATQDGYLTMDCLSATAGITYDYSLYNLRSYAMMTMGYDNSGTSTPSVSVKVRAGDTVSVSVGTISKGSELYPYGQFKFKAYFKGQDFSNEKEETVNKIAYALTVTDGQRKPVSGVHVKITGEGITTMNLTTDKNGVAGARLPEGTYKAVFAVPAGYKASTTEFTLTKSTPVVSAKIEKNVVVYETYKVLVLDENGKAVKDVMVAVGDRFAFTDDKGYVQFKMEMGDHVVVVAPPEGYTCDGSYAFPKNSTALTVNLRKGSSSDPDDPNKISYTVTVTDYNGKAMKNVAVKFMQNGELLAMSTTNSSGKATAKLAKGSYKVELAFASGKYYYNDKKATLSASKTTVNVLVAQAASGKSETLYVGEAYFISQGGTYVEMQSNIVNYFLFEPAQSGMYSFTTSDPSAIISYWGSNTNFIQDLTENTDYKNNIFTLNIKEGALGGSFVIGVTGADSCIIEIVRTGDAVLDETDFPWDVYVPKKAPSKYKLTMPAGKSLVYVDITKKTSDYKIVYNSNDGYYHFNNANGPVVLVNLGADAPYFPTKTALETGPIRVYLYDDKGNFVKKEEYTDCMNSYVSCIDETYGVYPLTDDLIYVIQQRGNFAGWWDPNGTDFLFGDLTGINSEIAWMFLLCYVG